MNSLDENARSYLEKILAILDIEATVSAEDIDETTTCFRIECRPDDARLLIGRNGATLEALQFIVRQMCKSGQSDQGPFVVDVLDYRLRRRRNLEDSAKRAAVEVLNGEQERIALPPMSPYERRIVHKYLQENFEELASESEGEGQDRHIVITYRGIPEEGSEGKKKKGSNGKRSAESEDDDYTAEEEAYGDEVEVVDEG
ncbi:MAG TPA: KH domain-containing protein [Candidatus Melainabacteria bacterium]|jgi:spoIIIJ-associated protein|nr:KH domain-containing protein [Candidatus Melainabacteria bacterium]